MRGKDLRGERERKWEGMREEGRNEGDSKKGGKIWGRG